MTRAKVYIECSSYLYSQMFRQEGWLIVENIEQADLVQFTGGTDVSPYLYGEKHVHPRTHSLAERDKKEAIVYAVALRASLPMAGICRGAQFLNVMCGGKLWQDVSGHASGSPHIILDMVTNEEFRATSTHHQMMIVGRAGKVIGVADESKWRSSMSKNGVVISHKLKEIKDFDPEIVIYDEAKVLCFQPHPEFAGVPDLKDRYFDYIYKYLFPKGYIEKGEICAA